MPENLDSALEALDLQILNAMQLDPRIPWNAVARIVGVDAATVARRWARIESEGRAWISLTEGPRRMPVAAFIEFSCEPGRVLEVADRVAVDDRVASLDLTAGRRDLLATLFARTEDALADHVLSELGALPGVRSMQTHVLDRIMRIGSDWSLGTLSAEQRARIPMPRPPRAGSAKRVDPALADALVELLRRDGRASFAELGAALGISAQRAADAVARLRRSGDVVLRVDVALRQSNWPVAAWYFIQAPAGTVIGSSAALADLDAVQVAASVTGPYPLIVAAGATSRAEALDFEAQLERRLPRARVADRSLILRVRKHLGRALDARGLARSATAEQNGWTAPD